MISRSILKVILLIILMASASCATKKIKAEESINQELHPKLIFLNYMISEEVTGNKKIQFINKIITDGKLKNNNDHYPKIGSIGDLICLQLDKDSTEITSITIKNPLSKHIEFVNDSLIFENKKIELKNAPISLRLRLQSKAKYITIKEITDSLQNSKTLIITKLD